MCSQSAAPQRILGAWTGRARSVFRGSRQPPSELEEPRDLEGYQPLEHLPSFGVTALGQHEIHIG